ncbi:MAG: TrmB family transcriptional regulator, partial [Candidatus Ranarchaeia archaeon]
TLASRGPLNPTEIATLANIPRPNIYPSLDRLIKEGLVLRETVGRGPRYLAVPFDQVAKGLKSDLEEKLVLLSETKQHFGRLLEESQYGQLSPTETAWLISGSDRITDEVAAIIKRAKSSIVALVTPELIEPLIKRTDEDILSLIEERVKNKVNLTLGVKIPPKTSGKKPSVQDRIQKLGKTGNLFPWTLGEVPFGSYVIDEKECLLTLIGRWTPIVSYDLAIWVRNPIFVKSFLYLTERLIGLGASGKERAGDSLKGPRSK